MRVSSDSVFCGRTAFGYADFQFCWLALFDTSCVRARGGICGSGSNFLVTSVTDKNCLSVTGVTDKHGTEPHPWAGVRAHLSLFIEVESSVLAGGWDSFIYRWK